MKNRTVGVLVVLVVILALAVYINAQRRDGMQWEDGTYIGTSKPDQRGYFGEIKIVIEKDKIKDVDYEELDSRGNPKGPDYAYPAGPKSHHQYEERLIKTQDPEKVESLTGATETHGRFQEAAQEALRKAKEGDQSKPPRPQVPVTPPGEKAETRKWKDGVYTAETDFDREGYRGEIAITIVDGRIAKVNYDEKDENGTAKGPEYPYPQGPESEDKYEERLLESQDPKQVEVISGATETWERFKEAAGDALQKAE